MRDHGGVDYQQVESEKTTDLLVKCVNLVSVRLGCCAVDLRDRLGEDVDADVFISVRWLGLGHISFCVPAGGLSDEVL